MQTEFNDNVLDYWIFPNGNFIVKSKRDDGLDGHIDVNNTLPSQLGALILSDIKRIMNNFDREIIGFYIKNIY